LNSRILILFLIFLTSQLGQSSPTYYVLGKKSYNSSNFNYHLADQLYNSFDQTNRIFQEADISFNFSFNNYVDLNTNWSRQVFHTHEEKTKEIHAEDKTQLLTVNSIFTRLRARSQFGVIQFGPATEYGVMFSVGKTSDPRQTNDYNVDFISKEENAKASKQAIRKLLLKKNCTFCSDKNGYIEKIHDILNRIWLGGVDKAENILQWILKPFMDDGAANEYNREPLAALKQQAIFGLPVDVNAFTQEDQRLNVGDVIKHTSFANFKPNRIGADLSNIWESDAHIFIRYMEEISIEKLANNQAKLQIRFIKSYGGQINFSRLSLSAGLGPRFNFLDWYSEDRVQSDKTFIFKYDLNDPLSKKHLQDLITENYLVDFIDVNSDEILESLPSGVDYIETITSNAQREDSSFYANFPILTRSTYLRLKNSSTQELYNSFGRQLRIMKAENLLSEERKK
jgi:hypothetical protein